MEKKLYDLKIETEFSDLIPPLQDTEMDMLRKSILANGCEMPLVVWGGTIVDGHNRYRICHENGVPFGVEEKQFDSREAAKIWIIRNQLGRRNLADFQKCELVLPLEELLKSEAEKRMQAGKSRLPDPVPNLAQGQARTRDTLASLAGVSHGTLDKAKKIIESADDQMKARLRRGELSIHRAYTDLKQAESQKGDSIPAEKTAADKSEPEKAANVSLLEKPVFDHYEPPAYMAPIPFEPVVPEKPEAPPAGNDISAESSAGPQEVPPAPTVIKTFPISDSESIHTVRDLIQTFLSDLRAALDGLDYRSTKLALGVIRQAGADAIETVQQYLNDKEDQQ